MVRDKSPLLEASEALQELRLICSKTSEKT